jgi:hypothetical protein
LHPDVGEYSLYAYNGYLAILDHTANTERIRLDSSGNIQIVGGNQMTQGLFFYNGGDGHLLSGIRNKSHSSYNDSGGLEFLTSGTSNAAESVKMEIDTQGNVSIQDGNLSISATKKIYVDGGSDTYLSEYSANEFEIVTGNTRKFALSGGNLYHTGSINSNHSFSDERLKENIVVIPNALEKISSLRGITFTRKDDGSVGTGLIAQELEKVLPEAVYKSKTIDSLENDDAEEWKAINYGNTVGLLVEAIKEQQVLIEALQKEVEELKGG